jgi:hypothetical protein
MIRNVFYQKYSKIINRIKLDIMVLLIQQNLESKEANQLCTILYKSTLVILSFHALKAQVKPLFECLN